MASNRPSHRTPILPVDAPGSAGVRREGAIDWVGWTRRINRKRRLLARKGVLYAFVSNAFLLEATAASFRLDGITLTDAELGSTHIDVPGRSLRSRLNRRIRNHVSIQRSIRRSLIRGEPLKSEWVLRWYTSIAAGLSTTMLAAPKMLRLEQVISRINSPHLRLEPALIEICRLHVEALRDEIVPGFNGILSRLLLEYHLGRCGLPPVVMDPERDEFRTLGEQLMVPRIMEMLDASFDRLK